MSISFSARVPLQHTSLVSRHCPSLPVKTRSAVNCCRDVRVRANPVVEKFAEMGEEEILQEVEDCQKELLRLRIDQRVGKEIKTHMFKVQKKKIAQLLTVKRQKEIEQGISKRLSRKQEKNRILKKYAQV